MSKVDEMKLMLQRYKESKLKLMAEIDELVERKRMASLAISDLESQLKVAIEDEEEESSDTG